MVKPDMFTHKLCALLDRNMIANRDIFDVYYFMQQKTPINKNIIEKRMDMEFKEYVDSCIIKIEKLPGKNLLNGIGEFIDNNLKTFVREQLKEETIQLFKMYRELPLFSEN